MHKPVILTGLRANNDLTIGNYFGGLMPLIDTAKSHAGDYQINLFVPDLHSFTTPIDHTSLQTQIMQNLRVFVAAGLPIDNDNVFIYRQSFIAAHSELTWIFDCFCGMGELSRMTQFKDKSSSSSEERVSVGLFNYPVLMAADILLYDALYIPVGDDQTQHLEFTRDMAMRFNSRFGELFVVPKPVKDQHLFFGKDQGLRIRDLINPEKKMSKSSDNQKGVIFLTDTEDEIRQKIMGATTDSYGRITDDIIKQPGITNLLGILELLDGNKNDYIGQPNYGGLKSAVADRLCELLRDFQKRLEHIDDDSIIHKLEASEMLMRDVASQKLNRVQQAVGLRPHE